MAKLIFRYGAMNSGKTSNLIQTAHNYIESHHKAIIIKPAIDTKGDDKIVTRVGLERPVDYLLKPEDSVFSIDLENVNAILVDESQFLTKEQVEELWYVTKKKDIAVLCYGLKVSFNSYSFPGSIRLFELADELTELPTLCECGIKARFIGRRVNGEYQAEGDLVVIDGTADVEYNSLCGKCYIENVLKKHWKSTGKVLKK